MERSRQCSWFLWCCILCGTANAQTGAPPTSPQLPKAQQLPLSGRPQNGSVTPVQTPATGAGAGSVNSVNPSIQIQGAYQGSVPHGTVSGEV